jgi:hypothetical protein
VIVERFAHKDSSEVLVNTNYNLVFLNCRYCRCFMLDRRLPLGHLKIRVYNIYSIPKKQNQVNFDTYLCGLAHELLHDHVALVGAFDLHGLLLLDGLALVVLHRLVPVPAA